MPETSLARRLGVALPVEADGPDLRDTFYSPSLRPLPPTLFPKADLEKIVVRDQGREGSCTGQALAAVIDLLRAREAQPPFPVAKASARMLVELARTIDQQGCPPPGTGEPTSLRPTLKAFYHHGVCLDEHWPYEAGDGVPEGLTKDRLDKAHALTLGAYYRLHPIVNDFHAALNEAGAVYVAAAVHPGWIAETVGRNNGCIPFDPGLAGSTQGGHAFAVVGYDQSGFLVLNSWGAGWGGYAGVPGLAHWSYEDWAFNVLDGWVVRLAVPTPKAFEYTIGRQGKLAGFDIGLGAAPGSMPRRQVLGHYLHLDDGAHVPGGPYPSSQGSLDTTVALLEEQAKGGRRKYADVLLWLAGANEGTEDVVADIARLKPVWLGRGVYPITVLWCTDFVGSIVSVLDGVFASAQAQVGEPGPALDRLIEARVRGPGRAFLRDIKRSSQRAVGAPSPCTAGTGKPGPFAEAFASLGRLRAAGYRLHVATEGVGAILLADLVAGTQGKASSLASVTLLAPALTEASFHALGRTLHDKGPVAWTLATASAAVEKRMRCGPYGGSILRLVDRAFEDDGPEQVVGLAAVAARARGALPEEARPRLAALKPDPGVERPLLRHLTRGSAAVGMVLHAIRPDGASARDLPGPPPSLHDRAL